MTNDEDNDTEFSVSASIGVVSLSVEGNNEEEVSAMFDEKLDRVMATAAKNGVYEDNRSYQLGGGAGWLNSNVEADSPEEAFELWLRQWEQMITTTENLTERQREQAGMTR